MNRSIFTLLVVSAIVMSASVRALAQPQPDVAQWLDRDVTLLFNVPNVTTTYHKIKSLDLFSNPRFIKAIEMLSDERFPIVGSDNLEQIRLRLLELEPLVRDIKQISIAVHDLDERQFHWSLFIRAESDVLDKVQREMHGIDGQFKKTAQPGDKDDPKLERGDVENVPAEPGSTDLGWGKIQRIEDWLILSNHFPFLDAVASRVSDNSFRSLAKSRKYLAIRKSKSPLRNGDGLITIYGNPVRMRYFFPHTTEEQWDLAKIDEMPACGLNLVITDSSDDDPSQPIVLADAIVKFTQPAAGQAKTFQAYRSVEVPKLAVDPIEFLAFSRDEAAVYAEKARLFDLRHGQGATDKKWADQFKETGLDNLTDAVARRQAYYEIRFINEKQNADRPGLVSLERLSDQAAAHRFVEGFTRFANDKHDYRLTRKEDSSNVWWTIPADRIEPLSGLRGFNRMSNSDVDFLNFTHDAYVLTDEWWVQGDMPVVREQVNLLTAGGDEDHGQPIRNLVEDLKRRLKANDQPFMIKYFTKDSWQENLNGVEQRYANANMHPVDIQLAFTQLSGNSIVLNVDPDAKDSVEIGGTFELQVEGIQSESPAGNKDQPTTRLNMSSLRFMMPLKLLARNEDGHRIELKKREDLETAIRVMILKSVSETFPRQLFLYTRNENHIRILMGAYPDRVPKDDE